MLNKKKISTLTFLAVLISIFLLGAIGISITLNYLELRYIEMQLDINKRQARTMARFLEEQLASGESQEALIKSVQHGLQGTEFNKGFLCIFDTTSAKLLCHPNPKMVGMKIPNSFSFDKTNGEHNFASDVIKNGKEASGLFKYKNRVDITYMVPVKGTSWKLSLHENINQIRKEIEKQRMRLLLGSIILGFLMAVLSTFAARKVSSLYEKIIEKKNKELDDSLNRLMALHEAVKQQKGEIESQRDYVTEQRDHITKQKKEITDSIEYARRIQDALLSSAEVLRKNFEENFIYYKPKDIISGDFYWFKEFEDIIYVAAADSTGHGVPGAMMSMLGTAILNEIVSNKTYSPGFILGELRKKIKRSLKQEQKKGSRDGMDIALCRIDKSNKQLEYAGAYNPLFFYDGELNVIQADRMPVGIHLREKKEFTNHKLSFASGNIIYLFSDGYLDQFGGLKGQKFKSRNFRALIAKSAELNLKEQLKIIAETQNWWIGDREQIDDILIIGIKL